MKKKLVWKNTSNRVVLKSVVVGHFAMWAVRQSPYPVPEELVKGIEEFSQARGFGNDEHLETTFANLQMIISDALSKSAIISSWNVAKKGAGIVFVSTYSEPKPDYDYIDLDALARNIAQSVWLELFYNEGGFE
jgi:hypothetical protein